MVNRGSGADGRLAGPPRRQEQADIAAPNHTVGVKIRRAVCSPLAQEDSQVAAIDESVTGEIGGLPSSLLVIHDV